MSKKILRILIVFVVSLVLMTGGILVWKWNDSPNSYSEKTNEPESNQLNEDQVNRIKNDLRERINRIKNSKNLPDPNDWAPYVVFKDKISCEVVGGVSNFLKEKEVFSSADIGSENYQEIVNLIKQAKESQEEWVKKRGQEAKQKLAQDPNLFYNAYELRFSGEIGPWPYWGFNGKQRNQEHTLVIPKNHPVFANFSIPRSHLLKYYHITGIENIPLVPSPLDGTGLYKIIKPENQITIKLIEN